LALLRGSPQGGAALSAEKISDLALAKSRNKVFYPQAPTKELYSHTPKLKLRAMIENA